MPRMEEDSGTWGTNLAQQLVATATLVGRACCCCDAWGSESREGPDGLGSTQHLLGRAVNPTPPHLSAVEVTASPSTRPADYGDEGLPDKGGCMGGSRAMRSALRDGTSSLVESSGNSKGERCGDGRADSRLSLLDDDDMCPTCLEAYTPENPKVVTKCAHHFHLPCIYSWLERSQTCPVCDRHMVFEELL